MITPKTEITIGRWSIPIPGTPFARRLLGIALLIGGVLGFLPVVGFWMIPLGLFVLSIDSALLRKYRRQWEVDRERKKREKQDKHNQSMTQSESASDTYAQEESK